MITDPITQIRLPQGFTARPVRMEDLEIVTELFNQYERSLTGRTAFTVEDIRHQWETPTFHINTDTLSIWSPAGEPVGYMEFWPLGAPHVRAVSWACTLPGFEGQGIGSSLLDWLIDRAYRDLPLAPEGTRVVLHQSVYSFQQSAAALLMQKGFNHNRSFYRMRIDFDGPQPEPVLPEGITIRAIDPGEERLAIAAVYDSFRDHYGFIEQPFETYYERMMHNVNGNPLYDPSLWFVAMDGGEVAGISLCYAHPDDDPEMGWVGTLGVRRPWRKHGLGMALLRHSFNEFIRRGKPRAGLGVDASSLTGATRLYERAGMRVENQRDQYELELRPGKDLMTQSIRE